MLWLRWPACFAHPRLSSAASPQVTDKGLASLMELAQLRDLGLAGCPVSDAGVAALAASLSNLTSLNLEWCAIGDAGFEASDRQSQPGWALLASMRSAMRPLYVLREFIPSF